MRHHRTVIYPEQCLVLHLILIHFFLSHWYSFTTRRRPSSIVEGYDSFPRYFIRRVFRAGLVIAMRWEGRAKNGTRLFATITTPTQYLSTLNS